jgi:predicted O-linked N-acetylglucosamine transferase (SPINDLY family)
MSAAQIQQLLSSAVQAQRAGRFADAESACRQAIALDANQPDPQYLLGLLCLQQRKPTDAIAPLERAIQLRPNAPEYHANLGHALRSVGRIDEAAAAYERAVKINPSYALGHSNLGSLRRTQGRIDEAIVSFQIATRLEPKLLPAWMNLGNALRDQNRLDDALNAYRRAAALEPNHADILGALATTLGQVGKIDEAIATFKKALEINPRHLPTLLNCGAMLRQVGDFDGAIDCLQKAVQVEPNNGDAHEKLARALWAVVRTDEALAHYQAALKLAPSPKLRVTVATLVPAIYKSVEDVNVWRNRLVEEVEKLHREGVKLDLTNETPPNIVYLPYQGLEDQEIAERIAGLCHAPQLPLGARSGDGRVRVGFISSLFRNQTVGLWTQGFIAKLDRSRFDVIVLSNAPHEDQVGRFIRQHADQYIVLPSALPAARQRIASLGLDVLIYADLGMETWTAALAYSRLAPVQCVTVGHPITSGTRTIDYYLSSALAEPEDAQQHYTEKLVRFEHLPVYYYKPRAPELILDRPDFDLPDDAHLYGCLQSQYKLHPSFDEAIGGILRADPKGLILLSRSGSAQGTGIIQSRLRDRFPDVVDRVRFMPSYDRERFRSLTSLLDVALAPFPFGAGDTSLEGFALGLPTVTLPTNQLKGRLTFAMYQAMKIGDCTARDVNDYIAIATRLGTDRAFNRSVRDKILAANHVLYENAGALRDLEQFLTSVLNPEP